MRVEPPFHQPLARGLLPGADGVLETFEGAAVEGGVTNVVAFDHVDDVFGDIGGVIADPFGSSLCLILVGLFFARPLFLGQTFFFRDLTLFYFPQRVRLVELIRSSGVPLWNPFVHGGQPFLANVDSMAFYPGQWRDSGWIDRTVGPCKQAMKDANLKPEQIDEVVLVGGSTRIPKVRSLVKEMFRREPHTDLNPDEVVALGAAVGASRATISNSGVSTQPGQMQLARMFRRPYSSAAVRVCRRRPSRTRTRPTIRRSTNAPI